MTREEAIEHLKDILCDVPNDKCIDWIEALNKAIEVLRQEPCEDAISRQATIDAIYKKHIGGKDAIENAPINDLYACGLEEAIDAVDNMPSVKPQPKTGHWIVGNYHIRCSECGEDYTYRLRNYCPNCGAKMQEVEE